MRAFMIILMILVGVVFVNTPATLLNTHFTPNWNIYIWVGIILAYYLIATLLPIDKIIGKIYPIFGFLLFGMALAIVAAFVYYKPAIPELSEELWHLLGHDTSVVDASFPVYDESKTMENSFNYPISFNGKMRFNLELPVTMNAEEVQAAVLAAPESQKWLEGKTPKKVIFVPKKIVNIVI